MIRVIRKRKAFWNENHREKDGKKEGGKEMLEYLRMLKMKEAIGG